MYRQPVEVHDIRSVSLLNCIPANVFHANIKNVVYFSM